MSDSPHSAFCCCPPGRCGAAPSPVDVASASNFESFSLRHLDLRLQLSFPEREVRGRLSLRLCPLSCGVATLVLDTHPSLLIHSVDCCLPEGFLCTGLPYRIEPFTEYGAALSIALPAAAQEPHRGFEVIVLYTAKDAPAIWWLDAELTCGNLKPFVFTQGHSVCNRSFFPCFDTPAVKSTYSATVTVPEGVQVLMSATCSAYSEQDKAFQFHMEHPVPAYLVALVAGELIPADIGPRSRIWAEPCILNMAVSKLNGQVESWLCAAERLFGPYVWGRYDIVFLPPSFPIVAMENPCLTFIISSILDSSDFLVVDLIHEIAHSWFGNAVTNATWEEMWLSEGLATYAQRRITTEAFGAAFTCLETAFRLGALHRQMRLLGENNPVSKLQVKFESGVNPSSLMNLFTYEKGFCFISYLAELCGDPQRFDDFLRAYIERFCFCSVVAQDLLDYYLCFFPELQDSSVADREGLEFERWLSACGPPPSEPDLSQGNSLTEPVETLCQLWTAGTLDLPTITLHNLAQWQTFQMVLFLDKLLDRCPLSHEVMSRLARCYSPLLDSNAEVRIRWLQLVVRSGYFPELHKVRRFLEDHTSRMYTVPLYEDLCSSSLKSIAVDVFCQSQSRMHANLRKTLQQILSQCVGPLGSTPVGDERATDTTGTVALRDVNVSA
ncbi:aminopeptidase RNPEPL1 [Erpetoichthys calabaricus]|uniref:Arginyl aminopeptidase like 1 n=1 Tax=Erpetoichthys calabaricus TaxID=27687 RepID=A0A8C4RSR6_ERPCA|nr:aminopeptidase RNPEPL1 [Erpetoichthys calabaricus]